jgi:hypothetical protein
MRARTGDGLMKCKAELEKTALINALTASVTFDDLKAVTERMLDRMVFKL